MSQRKPIKRRETNIHRNRKFNSRNRRLIYDALRSELPITRSLELIGIDRSTYYRWMEKGKSKRYPVHRHFRMKVKRILAQIQMKKLRIIQNAAKGYTVQRNRISVDRKNRKTTVITHVEIPPDWRAAIWFLERRFPKEYGKRCLKLPEIQSHNIASGIKSFIDLLMNSVPSVP